MLNAEDQFVVQLGVFSDPANVRKAAGKAERARLKPVCRVATTRRQEQDAGARRPLREPRSGRDGARTSSAKSGVDGHGGRRSRDGVRLRRGGGARASSLLLGLWRGLVGEMLALAAWVVGVCRGTWLRRDGRRRCSPTCSRIQAVQLCRRLCGRVCWRCWSVVAVAAAARCERAGQGGSGWACRTGFSAAVFGLAQGLAIAAGAGRWPPD
ncbi:MAG: CvpA family protein [Comamonadaceae bacterium]|nr:CvpA family protein [Comamonadaceae bacterium]